MEFNPIANYTPEMNQDVILTIHARNSSKLYEGSKKYELRKSTPRIIPRRMFLYESDKKILTGYIVIDGIITGSPSDVWDETGELGTTKERFFWYFEKSKTANAFRVSHAVRFNNPISLENIREIEPGFRPPQTYLYLSNLPKLNLFLSKLMIEESLYFADENFTSKPINDSNTNLFIELFEKHISGSYLDSDSIHARKIIEINQRHTDVEGIFTKSKKILEIYYGDNLFGFVVATMKYGGSIKTGPVILLPEFRNQGLGKKLRKFIHTAAIRAGYRKVYCTIPIGNKAALQYLLDSSYKIEGHLTNQYHHTHDELVLGYSLTNERQIGQEIIRPINSFDQFNLLKSFSSEAFVLFKEQFNNLYFQMPDEWFFQQIDSAISNSEKSSGNKGRYIFTAESNQNTTVIDANSNMQALAICIPKRGGSTKIIILTRSSHQESIIRFIEYLENQIKTLSNNTNRKTYSILPVIDTSILLSFWESGYKTEGVLDRPYNLMTDMIIVSKTHLSSTQQHGLVTEK